MLFPHCALIARFIGDTSSTNSHMPRSLNSIQYQELLRRLSKDRELVKKLRNEAALKDKLHKEELEELQGRVLRAENSAKWVADRNRELEARLEGRDEVRALEKKLQHALKVIVDLVAKVGRFESFIWRLLKK